MNDMHEQCLPLSGIRGEMLSGVAKQSGNAEARKMMKRKRIERERRKIAKTCNQYMQTRSARTKCTIAWKRATGIHDPGVHHSDFDSA
jgi:hypothetical protein